MTQREGEHGSAQLEIKLPPERQPRVQSFTLAVPPAAGSPLATALAAFRQACIEVAPSISQTPARSKSSTAVAIRAPSWSHNRITAARASPCNGISNPPTTAANSSNICS